MGKRIKITKSKGPDRYDGEFELSISRVRKHYVTISLDLKDLYILQRRVNQAINRFYHSEPNINLNTSTKPYTFQSFEEYYNFRKRLELVEQKGHENNQ